MVHILNFVAAAEQSSYARRGIRYDQNWGDYAARSQAVTELPIGAFVYSDTPVTVPTLKYSSNALEHCVYNAHSIVHPLRTEVQIISFEIMDYTPRFMLLPELALLLSACYQPALLHTKKGTKSIYFAMCDDTCLMYKFSANILSDLLKLDSDRCNKIIKDCNVKRVEFWSWLTGEIDKCGAILIERKQQEQARKKELREWEQVLREQQIALRKLAEDRKSLEQKN